MLAERIKKLHDSRYKLCLVTTGCGAGIQSMLFNVAGASRTILECTLAYSKNSLLKYVGWAPSQYVSRETAYDMAESSYDRAMYYTSEAEKADLIGVGITGALNTDREKKGECRAFITIVTSLKDTEIEIELDKNKSREAQEREVCERALNLILEAAGC